MKSVSKKLFSVLLVVAMLISMVPFQAFATEVTEGMTEHHAYTPVGEDGSKCVCGNKKDKGIHNNHSFVDGVCACGAKEETQPTETQPTEPKPTETQPTEPKPTETAEYADITVTVKEGGTTVKEFSLTNVEVGASFNLKKKVENKVANLVGGDIASMSAKETIKDNTFSGDELTKIKADSKMNFVVTLTLENETEYTLKLNYNGGMKGNESGDTKKAAANDVIVLPGSKDIKHPDGYTLLGWSFTKKATKADFTSSITMKADYDGQTLYAIWDKTQAPKLTVIGVYGNNRIDVGTFTMTPGQTLRKILTDSVDAAAEAAHPAGYEWDSCYYSDAACRNEVSYGSKVGESNRTIYTKYVKVGYTITILPGANAKYDGKTSATIKNVKVGDDVTIKDPTTSEAKYFKGWYVKEDSNRYFADTSRSSITFEFDYANDITLVADWGNSSAANSDNVILHVFTNGNFSNERTYNMTKYAADGKIQMAEVTNVIKNDYEFSSKNVVGLFNQKDWNNYANDKDASGAAETLIVKAGDDIYVMLTRANRNVVEIGNHDRNDGHDRDYHDYHNNNGQHSNNTHKNWDKTNPKTGDTAMIEVAGVTMILAAAAFVAVRVLRKKQII